MNESERQTLKMFKDGHTVKEIASKRDIKTSTVHNHLFTLVQEEQLSPEDVSHIISEKDAYLIHKTFAELDSEKLSDLKDHLDMDVAYDEIKLGLAMMEAGSPTSSQQNEDETSYRLLGSYDKTCGDYGGVNNRGTPCGLMAGSKLNRDYGRCQYHINQEPEERSVLEQWKLKFLRILQLSGMAWLVGSSGSDDVSMVNTIFSLSVVFLIILGIVLTYL